MILISDSGATKADWVALDDLGNELFSTSTLGLNPEVITREVILERLSNNESLTKVRNQVSSLNFYGAGCGTSRMQRFLTGILERFFPEASVVNVKEDTYGAVFSTIGKDQLPAIVCILGTGSNCCHWDGKKLHQKVQSLGYILMDDCSGNFFGRKIIRDYYFSRMPSDIVLKLDKQFNMGADYIKENIYKLPNPNKYLATFAKFMIENKSEIYFQEIIKTGIEAFIKNYILQYQEESKHLPVHFVGSISHYLSDEIKSILEKHNLIMGNVVKSPIEGMISYYKNQSDY